MRQRVIKQQKTNVKYDEKFISTHGDSNSSPYWHWLQKKQFLKEDFSSLGLLEDNRANPDNLGDENENPELILERKERIKKINDMIKILSLTQFKVIWLLTEGKTQDETAKELGISRGAVKTHLNRARNKCKFFVSIIDS